MKQKSKFSENAHKTFGGVSGSDKSPAYGKTEV